MGRWAGTRIGLNNIPCTCQALEPRFLNSRVRCDRLTYLKAHVVLEGCIRLCSLSRLYYGITVQLYSSSSRTVQAFTVANVCVRTMQGTHCSRKLVRKNVIGQKEWKHERVYMTSLCVVGTTQQGRVAGRSMHTDLESVW
jgi:hypothetical protein